MTAAGDTGARAVGTTAAQAAVCTCAAVHGLVPLCWDRPGFRWPGLAALIDTALAARLHAPGRPQAPDAGRRTGA